MKKILIMGGSGFIGRAVIEAYIERGIEVHATFHKSKPSENGKVVWHQIDLLDANGVNDLFAIVQPEFLIQLAWCTGQGSYWKDEANLDWLAANLLIAKSFVRNGGNRCLFAGTSAEYDWSSNQPLDEYETNLEPLLLYGGSKLGLYWALKKYFEQHSVSFLWARFFNPFGEGEDPRRLIPKTCLRLLGGENLVFDAAMSLRDFLHVKDVGNAIAHLLDSNLTGPVNVASGQAISVREVISTIAEIYERSGQISFDSGDPVSNKPDAVVANTRRLNLESGWKSNKTFKDRITETCEWWMIEYKILQRK
ncbi:NAD-dependent epimerase/dehydratase family protein [Flavitalea sp.]|nr:NAD(P)-dependent oxidoreductase [Flavitalea sp.]